VTKTGGVDVVLNHSACANRVRWKVSTDEQGITQITPNQIGAIFVTKAFMARIFP